MALIGFIIEENQGFYLENKVALIDGNAKKTSEKFCRLVPGGNTDVSGTQLKQWADDQKSVNITVSDDDRNKPVARRFFRLST